MTPNPVHIRTTALLSPFGAKQGTSTDAFGQLGLSKAGLVPSTEGRRDQSTDVNWLWQFGE
ncbi:MAG: hypothetical protein J4203_05650 [Candidatus Diapherotrites archaeon]|uniref:Uncharacterized protein n=1 Tax=Candidatus Iainarchaeum sp. TaxID=3101447 RepID=A0A8T4L7U8_9ARCH|nr:hypothetical protein [Candidatus Diapherotrites archaeon]